MNNITKAFSDYLEEVKKLDDMLYSLFSLVQISSDHIDAGKVIDEDGNIQVNSIVFPYLKATMNVIHQETLYAELLLCRLVDAYQIYLTDLIKEIYIANPQRLRSEDTKTKTLTVNDVLQYSTMEDFINSTIKDKIFSLSYNSLYELNQHMENKLKFSLFTTKEAQEEVTLCTEIRNIIVHNHGRVNSKFKMKLPKHPATEGEQLKFNLHDLSVSIKTLGKSAKDIDERAIPKFGLKSAIQKSKESE